MRAKNKKKFPFAAQIAAIVLAGAAAGFGAFALVKEYTAEKHTVTFAYDDGSVIEIQRVKAGKSARPPLFETDDVFRGWNSAVDKVNENREARPTLYPITDDVNLFYFNSVYVREGKSFSINLRVAGDVNVNSGELILEYDADVMEYQKAKESDFCAVKETEPGSLTVKFHSEKPITETYELAEIVFRSKKIDAHSSEITLQSKNVVVVKDGIETPAYSATINNKIYFL